MRLPLNPRRRSRLPPAESRSTDSSSLPGSRPAAAGSRRFAPDRCSWPIATSKLCVGWRMWSAHVAGSHRRTRQFGGSERGVAKTASEMLDLLPDHLYSPLHVVDTHHEAWPSSTGMQSSSWLSPRQGNVRRPSRASIDPAARPFDVGSPVDHSVVEHCLVEHCVVDNNMCAYACPLPCVPAPFCRPQFCEQFRLRRPWSLL